MRILLGLLGALLVGACVRADATSYTDPAAHTGQVYERVLVMAAGLPLDQAQAVEGAAVEALGPGAIPSMSAIPLSVRENEEAFAAALEQLAPDAALVIYGIDATEIVSQMPTTYWPGQTYGTVSVIGNSAYVNTYTTPGYTTGGGAVVVPRATFGAKVLDGETGATVWQANVNTRGSAFDDFVGLARGAAREAVAQARADGVLK